MTDIISIFYYFSMSTIINKPELPYIYHKATYINIHYILTLSITPIYMNLFIIHSIMKILIMINLIYVFVP